MKKQMRYILPIFLALTLVEVGCSKADHLRSEAEAGKVDMQLTATPSVIPTMPPPMMHSAQIVGEKSAGWITKEVVVGRDDFSAIHFVDNECGFLASLGGDKTFPESPKLRKTVNGGTNWSELKVPFSSDSFVSSIWFVNRERGSIVLQSSGTSMRDSVSKISVLETEDGGASWNLRFELENAVSSDLRFDAAGNGWLVGLRGKATYVHNAKPLALYSDDFGKT